MADTRVVCELHRNVPLTDVREIASDVARPRGVTVIGKCRECQKPTKMSKTVRSHIWSYGDPNSPDRRPANG